MFVVAPDVNVFVGAGADGFGLPCLPRELALRQDQVRAYYALGDGQRFIVATSEYLLHEVEQQLIRLGAPSDRARAWLEEVRRWCWVIQPEVIADVVPDDYDDNNVLAVASEARRRAHDLVEQPAAYLVVSTDPHLVDIEEWDGILTTSARTFLHALGSA